MKNIIAITITGLSILYPVCPLRDLMDTKEQKMDFLIQLTNFGSLGLQKHTDYPHYTQKKLSYITYSTFGHALMVQLPIYSRLYIKVYLGQKFWLGVVGEGGEPIEYKLD